MSQSPPLVTPFLAEHFADVSNLSGLVSPPYDVISPERRRVFAARNECNVVNLILPDGDGDRYARAREILDRWRRQGVLVRDDEPGIYVLQQQFTTPAGESLARTGVIAAVAVEPYGPGRVKPHERTHKGPKEDRLALLRATEAMFEALLMMAPDRTGALRETLSKVVRSEPWAVGELDGAAISVWYATGSEAVALADGAADGFLYIADGHHRYETANAYLAENPKADRTLGMIVPLGDPGLVALPTHRILSRSVGQSVGRLVGEQVRALLGADFDIEAIDTSANVVEVLERDRGRRTSCAVMFEDSALRLVLKSDADVSRVASEPSVRALDVARVDELVVKPLVRAVGEGATVSYSPDPAEVRRRVTSGEVAAGVLLNPTAVEDVLAVADAGAFMPQKSTYFAPKVPSGLVVLGY